MKTFLQLVLIAWFLIFSVIIFIPALKLLFSKETFKVSQIANIPRPPNAPKSFAISLPDSIKSPEGQKKYIEKLEMKVKLFEKSVAIYDANVKAYSSQIESIKTYNSTFAKTSLKDVYVAIVNDQLLSILTSLVTAFIAYTFVKGGVNMYFNRKAAATSKELEHFSLF